MQTEFAAPGSSLFHSEQSGQYKVFVLTGGVTMGEYDSPSGGIPEGLVVTVVRKADGQSVKLSQGFREDFSGGGKSGVSLFDFEADKGVDYLISGSFRDDSQHAPIRLGVGKGLSLVTFVKIFALAGLGALCSFAGIIIAIVTFIRWLVARSKNTAQIPPPILPAAPGA